MLTYHTPASIRAPFAAYSHGVEVAPNARWLLCSGQLGIDAEDYVPDDVEGQARLCFANITAILSSADMGLADIVRINAYVSDAEYLAGYMKVRDAVIGAPPPASTLMVVTGFARPHFKVEIEAIAARAA